MHGEGSVLIRRGIQLLLSKKNAPNDGTRAIAGALPHIALRAAGMLRLAQVSEGS